MRTTSASPWLERTAWRPGRDYNGVVRRLVIALTGAILILSASGVSSLAIAEPCSAHEPPGQRDTACPPTCVTCGCCGQALEPVVHVLVGAPDALVSEIDSALPSIPLIDPHPILHVPKLGLA